MRLLGGPFDNRRTRSRLRCNHGDSSLGRRRDCRLRGHKKRIRFGTVVCDKGRSDVDVRPRPLDVNHWFLPLGEEDRERETKRNDGNGGRILRRAQESVLGSLLWNITYDHVLTVLPVGV